MCPIAIDAANKASGIVGIVLIFPVIVSSKMFLAVRSGSRLAAKATYLAEGVSAHIHGSCGPRPCLGRR